MLSWTQIVPFPDDPDAPNSYELHAEVGNREYVISANTAHPDWVGVSLMIDGRLILDHVWWDSGPSHKACGDRILTVSDAKEIAEDWETAEVWKHRIMDRAEPTTVNPSDHPMEWGSARDLIEHLEMHAGIVPICAVYDDEREDTEDDNERLVTMVAYRISYRTDNTGIPQVAIVVDNGNGYFLTPDDAIRLSQMLQDAAAAATN